MEQSKTSEQTFGLMTGHAVGRILKETVRRAMVVIRSLRKDFDLKMKEGYDGKMDDVCTTADMMAQEIFILAILECFPSYGIIAEEPVEMGSQIPGREHENYFTIDPLDGTKAYTRRQSHGVGTMVAMVHRGAVVSAYVGDVNTEEVYGYRPGSRKVHRITCLDTAEVLSLEVGKLLKESIALLREPADTYSPEARELLKRFKSHEVMSGSIGTWMARLWKGEVAAAFLPPGWETPWDSTPVIGISEMLDCVYLSPNGGGEWAPFVPPFPREVYLREHEMIVIPRHYLAALLGK